MERLNEDLLRRRAAGDPPRAGRTSPVAAPSLTGAFPRLASLRLTLCDVRIEDLQGIIDAALALATLHLESVHLFPPKEEALLARLRFPEATTALVLDKCCWGKENYYENGGSTTVEIDAPRLQHFRYRGLLRKLSLSSLAPDLNRVDLHFVPGAHSRRKKELCLVMFWRLLGNFSSAKELKVRVNHLEDIAVLTAARRAELLCAFRNLERLEVEGVHRPKGKTAAVAIANLLRCCPVLVALRIKLNTAQSDHDRSSPYKESFLLWKYQSDSIGPSIVSRAGDQSRSSLQLETMTMTI